MCAACGPPGVVRQAVHDVGGEQAAEDHDLRRDHPPDGQAARGHPRGAARVAMGLMRCIDVSPSLVGSFWGQ